MEKRCDEDHLELETTPQVVLAPGGWVGDLGVVLGWGVGVVRSRVVWLVV